MSCSNPNRRNRTPHCLSLRYQVFAMKNYLLVYNRQNYYIHVTLVYNYILASPILHQYDQVVVIVIVYWSNSPDEVILCFTVLLFVN